MANKKINDLAAAGSVLNTMQLETDIGGTTANKVTALQIKNYIDAASLNHATLSNLTFDTANHGTGKTGFQRGTTSSATDPTVNDDNTQGYREGDFWVNRTSNTAFICVDPATGAAIWHIIEHSASDIWTKTGSEVTLTTPTDTFGATNPLTYTSHPTFTADAQIVDKKYVDDHASNGIWQRIGTVISPKNAGDTYNLGTGIASYSAHPSFTADTEIIDKKYVDDNIPFAITDLLTISTPGQTAFTLSSSPLSAAAFSLYLNGQLRQPTVDYTFTGTSLTWNDPGGVTLETTDIFIARYNDSGAGVAVTSVFGRTGSVVAIASDYDASQIDNDSGVSGTYVSNALDTLDTAKAAAGANSDITSLSGLTTPLSIAQGGTNSGTALSGSLVMASSGSAIVESLITTAELNLLSGKVSVSTGSSNNDKLVTQGYVDDAAVSKALIAFGASSILATTVTRYLFPSICDSSAPNSILNFVIPFAGTIRNMYVYHNVTAGNGNNIVYTLLQNASPTSLTVTIPSTTQTASDTSNTVSVSAGDRLALQVTKALSIGSSPVDIYVTMEIN